MTETMAPVPPASTSTAVPMLEARNIFKSFGSVQALTDVDFEVRAGEVMALVGDNGAGKSTLIKCLAGIYSIDEGDVFFEGKKVSISTPKDAAKLGHRGRVPGSRALRQPRRRPEHVPRPRGARHHLAPQGIGHGGEDGPDAEVALGHDDPLDPAARGKPLGRPAPVGRHRPRGDVELPPRHPRRADRGTRRRSDPAGPRSRQATRRSGSRGHPHLAQPPRHLRGGGPHHGAPPRAQRGIAQSARSDPAGGRPRHHGGRPDEGRGSQPDDGRGGRHERPRQHGRYPGRGRRVAGREQPGRPHAAPLGGDQGGRRGHVARDPRPDPDRRPSSTRRTATTSLPATSPT